MTRGPFAKIYASLWRGTLGESWEAWSLFVYMLANCGREGVVDQTHENLARCSGMPLESVRRAVAFLEAPDPSSRSTEAAGARIVRLDGHRDWGWRIVNLAHYRDGDSAEWSRTYRERHRDELRERDRDRKRHVREASVSVRDASVNVRQHADADNRSSPPHHQPPNPTDKPEVVFVWLPTNVRDQQYPVSEAQVLGWQESFPGVDVRQQLRTMREWLLAKQKGRKTHRGMAAFVVTWLSRHQDRARPAEGAPTPIQELPTEGARQAGLVFWRGQWRTPEMAAHLGYVGGGG